MFFKKSLLVFIFGNVIRVKLSDRVVKDYQWSMDNLDRVVDVLVHESNASSVRIVLGESNATVLSLAIEKNSALDKSMVQDALRNEIPELLDTLVWDYRVSSSFELYLGHKIQSVVQVSAVDKEMALRLVSAFKKTNVSIDVVQPISIALAYYFKDRSDPFVLFYFDRSSTLSVIYQGLVVFSELVDQTDLTDKVSGMLTYVYNRYGIKPTHAIVASKQALVDDREIEALGLSVIHIPVDPLSVIADYDFDDDAPKLSSRVKSILGSVPRSINRTASKQHTSNNPSQLVRIASIVGLVVLIVGVVGYGIWFLIYAMNPNMSRNDLSETNSLGEIVHDTATESGDTVDGASVVDAGSISIDTSEVEIVVLNGSGIEGAAGTVATVLNQAGYDSTSSSNADNYNYQGITIVYRDEAAIESHAKKIADLFDGAVDVESSLNLNSSVDIQLIVGQ